MGLVSDETLGEVNYNYTEEELEERKNLIYDAQEKLNSYGLKWTFRGISYLVNRENVSLNSLRNFIFIGKDGQPVIDLERAVLLLLTTGLISSQKIEEKEWNSAIEKAYNIMEDWIISGRHISILHCLIINIMTEKHFFIESKDAMSLDGLALMNIEKSLTIRHLAIAEEAKMQQMFNYSQIN